MSRENEASLTDQQWDFLRLLVANHRLNGGAEFYYARNMNGAGISYAGWKAFPVTVVETDLRQLRREGLIDFVSAPGHSYRGKPTQLGITRAQRGPTPPTGIPKTIAVDSSFWSVRRADFERLPAGEYSLIWTTDLPMSLAGELLPSQWSWWQYPDESIRTRFTAIALLCAKALGHDAEEGWLDELRKSDFVKFKLSGQSRDKHPDGTMVDSEFGVVKDVVKHSITLCHILEASVSSFSDVETAGNPALVQHLHDLKAQFSEGINPDTGRSGTRRSVQKPMTSASRSAIKKYADEIFSAGLEDRSDGYQKTEGLALHEAALKNNVGAYVPTLIRCKQEELHAEIAALGDAWIQAASVYGVPLGDWAHRALGKDVILMAAGVGSALRGELDLHASRTKTARVSTSGSVEIDRAMKSALRKVKVKLEAQRIRTERLGRDERPQAAASAKKSGREYKTALARNVDRLRKECGWSFDDLAEATELDKKLILGHVTRGKGAHPKTLETYAQTLSQKLGRPVTVAELEG